LKNRRERLEKKLSAITNWRDEELKAAKLEHRKPDLRNCEHRKKQIAMRLSEIKKLLKHGNE